MQHCQEGVDQFRDRQALSGSTAVTGQATVFNYNCTLLLFYWLRVGRGRVGVGGGAGVYKS